MTFEEYLEPLKVFGGTDKPEVRAHYERQYRNHLLHVEDAAYFEPLAGESGDDLITRYEQNLARIFRLDAITEEQLYLQVRPAFEAEQLLAISRTSVGYQLTHTVLRKNYWLAFYNDPTTTDMEAMQTETMFEKAAGDKLYALMDTAFADARAPRSNRVVLDGVKYILSKRTAGAITSVSKHSPDPASRSGKIIGVMQLLLDHVSDEGTAAISAALDDVQS